MNDWTSSCHVMRVLVKIGHIFGGVPFVVVCPFTDPSHCSGGALFCLTILRILYYRFLQYSYYSDSIQGVCRTEQMKCPKPM